MVLPPAAAGQLRMTPVPRISEGRAVAGGVTDRGDIRGRVSDRFVKVKFGPVPAGTPRPARGTGRGRAPEGDVWPAPTPPLRRTQPQQTNQPGHVLARRE